MIESTDKKIADRMNAIASASKTEQEMNATEAKAAIKEVGKASSVKNEDDQKSSSFSFFKKKSRVEEIKKKLGPAGISGPITADKMILEAAQTEIIERYPIREPIKLLYLR